MIQELEQSEKVFFGFSVPDELAEPWFEVGHKVANLFQVRDLALRSVPHITMIPPQGRDQGLVRSIMSRIDAVVRDHGPVHISVGGPILLNEDTVALDVSEDRNRELYKLVGKIRQSVEELPGYEPYAEHPDFHAHISVVRYIDVLTESRRQEVLEQVHKAFGDDLHYEYEMGHVSVFGKFEDRWSEIKKLRIPM